jgi:4-hydroxy-tetrahydrodipicolinate reductase
VTTTAVAVFGAAGKMGRAACEAIEADDRLDLVARLGRDTPREVADGADVIVDLTHPESVLDNVLWAIGAGKHAVVGTTGLGASDEERLQAELEASGHELGILLVPNFSIGAYLARRFAQIASRYYDAAEIIEYSHERKAEAPSGTALSTARGMSDARDAAPWPATPAPHDEGARGLLADGTPVHSVRLPGLVNRQEVILAGSSELVTLRYETLDRSAFMPGLIEAVTRVGAMPGIHRGLEALYDDV